LYVYSGIAEKFANEYMIGKKEKEIIIELLEHFIPPKKRDLGELRGQSKKVQPMDAAQKAKQKEEQRQEEAKQALLNFRNSGVTQLTDLPLEECIKGCKKRVPELKLVAKEYEKDAARYAQICSIVSVVDIRVNQNNPMVKIESQYGEKVAEQMDTAKCRDEEYSVSFKLTPSSIFIRNIRLDTNVIFHALSNYQHYATVSHIEIINSPLPEAVIRMVIDIISINGSQIEHFALKNCLLGEDSCRAIAGLLCKRPLKFLSLVSCNIDSKMLADLCIGAIAGRSLEVLELSGNRIGNLQFKKTSTVSTLCAT